MNNIFIRSIVFVWILGFISCVATDIWISFQKPPLIEYVVENKLQEYSYYKNNSIQVNKLLLRNTETNSLETKDVDVATHYGAKVGNKIYFRNEDRVYYTFSFIFLSFVVAFIVICGILIFTGLTWTITGKFGDEG